MPCLLLEIAQRIHLHIDGGADRGKRLTHHLLDSLRIISHPIENRHRWLLRRRLLEKVGAEAGNPPLLQQPVEDLDDIPSLGRATCHAPRPLLPQPHARLTAIRELDTCFLKDGADYRLMGQGNGRLAV